MAHKDNEPKISFQDIRAELQSRIGQLARELAPRNGHKHGDYWLASDPTDARPDKHPSFWIRIAGTARGAWKDQATGEGGDVISLVTHCKRLNEAKPGKLTFKWCLAWLGWDKSIDPARLEVKRKAQRYIEEQDDRLAREDLDAKRKQAFWWWHKKGAAIEGTPVATYLASRGIELARLAQPPRALRFQPHADHVDKHGEITQWPVMLAAMCVPGGRIIAVHRTFIASDGQGKAPVAPQKKIWPHGFQGSVIRIAKGASKMTPEKASEAGIKEPLVLAEGIENALSIALACPELRVWAAGTLGNLEHAPVDMDCISNVIIFADNDAGPQPRGQLDKAVEALRRKRPVSVARSMVGKDANDLLRKEMTT